MRRASSCCSRLGDRSRTAVGRHGLEERLFPPRVRATGLRSEVPTRADSPRPRARSTGRGSNALIDKRLRGTYDKVAARRRAGRTGSSPDQTIAKTPPPPKQDSAASRSSTAVLVADAAKRSARRHVRVRRSAESEATCSSTSNFFVRVGARLRRRGGARSRCRTTSTPTFTMATR